MFDLLDKLDNVWTLISLLIFTFVLGVRTAWTMMGGRKRILKNEQLDRNQQDQINDLWAHVNELLRQKGVKKVTVKRTEKKK